MMVVHGPPLARALFRETPGNFHTLLVIPLLNSFLMFSQLKRPAMVLLDTEKNTPSTLSMMNLTLYIKV